MDWLLLNVQRIVFQILVYSGRYFHDKRSTRNYFQAFAKTGCT
jgi:NADH:ubiquinone oxidoreductase subunit 5 (subunit L)/multisubunit Na+/H+ antiporter MnhA subunit